MCIDVTNKHPEPTGIGWKVFEKDGRYLMGEYATNITRRRTKRWLDERYFRGNRGAKTNYAFGWHIYINLADANSGRVRVFTNMVVRKVRYRGAFLSGPIQKDLRGEGFPTVVAKEILILPGEVT